MTSTPTIPDATPGQTPSYVRGQASEAAADFDAFRGDRLYLGADHRRNERRTWIVTAICAVSLVGQITGGLLFNSMALTASGLHMAAHVAALLVATGAYALARRYAHDSRFSFGTGKLGYLAGFANAVVLAVTAIGIAAESITRLLNPEAVDFHHALPLAGAGLAINIVCALMLRPTVISHHRHDHDGDLNISAAHLHLTADVAASLLAIVAISAGHRLGWGWADAAAGLAGAALVAHFAWSLLRRTSAALLDINPSAALTAEVRGRLQQQGEQVIDLHLWRLGPGHHAALAVVSAEPAPCAEALRARLKDLAGISHVTIEPRGPDGREHHHPHA